MGAGAAEEEAATDSISEMTERSLFTSPRAASEVSRDVNPALRKSVRGGEEGGVGCVSFCWVVSVVSVVSVHRRHAN